MHQSALTIDSLFDFLRKVLNLPLDATLPPSNIPLQIRFIETRPFSSSTQVNIYIHLLATWLSYANILC